jgi:hypothetical protein
VRGRFDKAPLTLDAMLSGSGAARAVRISGDWKSLALRTNIALPAKGAMTGQGTLNIKSLDDLRPFIGASAKGALHMTAQLTAPGGKAALAVKGRVSDIEVRKVVLG